jgi:hypothetical protein
LQKIELKLKTLNLAIHPEITRRRGMDKALAISHQDKLYKVIEIIKEFLNPHFESVGLDQKNLRPWKMHFLIA